MSKKTIRDFIINIWLITMLVIAGIFFIFTIIRAFESNKDEIKDLQIEIIELKTELRIKEETINDIKNKYNDDMYFNEVLLRRLVEYSEIDEDDFMYWLYLNYIDLFWEVVNRYE